MKKLIFLLYIIVGMLSANAQYRVLHNFGSIPGDGSTPYGSLTLLDGKLYGMSRYGGIRNNGCIFSIDTNGANYKILLSFDSLDGNQPWGNLMPIGKRLYGMTSGGWATVPGNIFSIDTDGNGFRDIFDFNGTDGAAPFGSLIFVENKLYGMTYGGGYGLGVIFSVDTDGSGYNTLYSFKGNSYAPEGSLIYAAGVLYGMTTDGGLGPNYGTVFSIDTDGNNFQVLYEFQNTAWPRGSLARAGKKLYGMTSQGGEFPTDGSLFGNIFSIDTDGNNYTIPFAFRGGTTGASPYGSLTLSGNKFYGMTYVNGGVFSIDTNGSGFDTIHDFANNGLEGGLPWGDVTISGNMLYGMTSAGGSDSVGVIFSFNYITAGINNLTANNGSIKVYPNPSNGLFTVSLSNVNTACNVEIYNVLGEKVYTETLHQGQSSNTINLTGQPNGVYLYRVLTNTGNLIGEGKIVKE